MERDCYCCRPGPSLPSPAPSPYQMEPHSISRSARQAPHSGFHQHCDLMDVDSALCELDSLRSATASMQPSTAAGSLSQEQRPERKVRARSLSESMASSSHRPAKSHSETSLYRPLETDFRTSHHRRACAMGAKMIGGSMSLPRKIGTYHMVLRNTAFVSDICGSAHSRSPLQHSVSLPARWVMGDSGMGSYSDQSSSKSSSPSSMGSYRESDLLEERSRQRRLSRVRLDRSRRLRQPYSIPFRMCQSMSEDSTASLNDFLTGAGASRTSQSTTASPVKQDTDPSTGSSSGVGSLVRSRSIDNLELAKLRLTDILEKKGADSYNQQTADVEQVATELKNLRMV